MADSSMTREEGPENAVTYYSVLMGPSVKMTHGGFSYVRPSGESSYFDRKEVLALRDFCNAYMREFGAVDSYGREVIDRAGNV